MQTVTFILNDGFRLNLIKRTIEMLQASGDPAAAAAIAAYEGQLATVQARIDAANQEERGQAYSQTVDPTKPPAQVITMQTLGLQSALPGLG